MTRSFWMSVLAFLNMWMCVCVSLTDFVYTEEKSSSYRWCKLWLAFWVFVPFPIGDNPRFLPKSVKFKISKNKKIFQSIIYVGPMQDFCHNVCFVMIASYFTKNFVDINQEVTLTKKSSLSRKEPEWINCLLEVNSS